MSFININLNQAEEAKPVVAGFYDLTIAAAEKKFTKENKPQFRVQIAIDGHDDAPNVFEYVPSPDPDLDTDKKSLDFKVLLLARFCRLFKIPVSDEGYNPDDLVQQMVGCTARAELKVEEYEGNLSNKLVVPRLTEEKGVAGAAGKGSPPKRVSKAA
ncbi:MAG TPA: hypothetical protein VF077_09050 [Nitrospiraceae bacterium]